MHNDPPERPQRPDPEQLARIFGRDLGEEDESSPGDERAREDWYRENRPPHHE